MRLITVILVALLSITPTFADEKNKEKYVMYFDLITKTPDGEVGYSIQLQGIHLLSNKEFHGDDLGEFDYFFTVSGVGDGKAQLTVEFYQYESRRKASDIISEIVAEVDFMLGSPAQYEAKNDKFGIDLAFSIDRE